MTAELPENQISDLLKTVSDANEASVLMTVLLQKMGLEPKTTTHNEFVDKFSTLQKASLDAQKVLNDYYMLAQPAVKQPKKRKPRTSESEAETN